MTTINVTQQHIEAGSPHLPTYCPSSLAINEHLAPPYFASVAEGRVLLYTGIVPADYVGTLSVDAWMRILDFDLTGRMQPFTFDLDLPLQFLKGE